uniref:Uncharacterized protein n=1 Tax=Romanomermis culicivorax TaxID=13658 RepID=A0A915I0W3_ROMCU
QKPPYVKARNRLARSEHWSLEKEKIERLLTSSPVDLPSTASADGDVPALISDVSDQDDDEINLEYSGDNNRIDLFYNDDSAQNRRKYSDPDFKNRDNFENRDDDDDVVTLSGGLEAISDDDDDDAERKPQPQRRCVLRDDRRGYSKNERLRHRRRRSRDDVDRLNKKRRGESKSSKSVFDRLGDKLTITVENDRRRKK